MSYDQSYFSGMLAQSILSPPKVTERVIERTTVVEGPPQNPYQPAHIPAEVSIDAATRDRMLGRSPSLNDKPMTFGDAESLFKMSEPFSYIAVTKNLFEKKVIASALKVAFRPQRWTEGAVASKAIMDTSRLINSSHQDLVMGISKEGGEAREVLLNEGYFKALQSGLGLNQSFKDAMKQEVEDLKEIEFSSMGDRLALSSMDDFFTLKGFQETVKKKAPW